jgi:hypothetical protein
MVFTSIHVNFTQKLIDILDLVKIPELQHASQLEDSIDS